MSVNTFPISSVGSISPVHVDLDVDKSVATKTATQSIATRVLESLGSVLGSVGKYALLGIVNYSIANTFFPAASVLVSVSLIVSFWVVFAAFIPTFRL